MSSSICIESEALRVDRALAQKAIEILKKVSLYNSMLKAINKDRYVLIPVLSSNEAAVILLKYGIEAKPEKHCFPKGKSIKGLNIKNILEKYLSKDILKLIPRSFEIIGDIALIELNPEIAKQYGEIVAKAIMELHPHVKAVYARGSTHGVTRIRELIHLAGEKRTKTIHKEYGIRIVVDIAQAYFNPSLATEHYIVSQNVYNGMTILDAFTGVGPFALHIARKAQVYVIACDINSYALKLLRESIHLNKLRGLIEILNTDSIELLRSDTLPKDSFDMVILNLPHQALRMICHAIKILKSRGIVHVYTIARSSNEAIENLNKELTSCENVSITIADIRRVLDYAPRKYIYRISLVKL
ncbi:MAG TPA: class I SAM-dependent methyltransferase family protein [Ignisphaera sp.]|nr:class I SAM-dependent methyltransferase family protein [Ignisphaera sp.]